MPVRAKVPQRSQPTPEPKDFGAWLHAERTKRRWTQAELGKKLHCHQTLISQIETGVKVASVEFKGRARRLLSPFRADL